MYKVFIKNNELSFILKQNKLDNYNIVMSENIAINNTNELINKMLEVDTRLKYAIISDNIENTFLTFFSYFVKVEAAGGLVKRKNSYLFIFRKGFWDLPKGKLDFDESPNEAALREIEEECGIKNMKIQELITETYHIYNDYGEPTLKKTYWYLINYKGDKKLKPQKEEDIEIATWKKIEEIENELLKNTYLSIKQVWKTYCKNFL